MSSKKIALSIILVGFIIVIFTILLVYTPDILDIKAKEDPFLRSDQEISDLDINISPASCSFFSNQVYFAHRGGNITKYQENTLEVFIDSALEGRDIEIDIMFLNSGDIVAFHDLDTFAKTGITNKLIQSNWNQIKDLKYLNVIDEKIYLTNPSIPLLSQALNAICKINNRTNIWLDAKYGFGYSHMEYLLKAFEDSPCVCDDSQKIVIETYRDFLALNYFKLSNSKSRCKLLTAISFYGFHSENSFESLKNDLINYMNFIDIVDFHASIIKKYPELLNFNFQNKICNSVYGDDKALMREIVKYSLIDVVIYDFYQ